MSGIGDRLGDNLPDFDLEDEAVRDALYGAFGHYDDWRSVVLDNCKEIVRATTKEKLTEERVKNLARTHPLYLDFITTHVYGKIEYSRDKKKAAAGGFGA